MGLRKLGFRADVAAVFRSMDPNSSGLVSLKARPLSSLCSQLPLESFARLS